MKPAPASWPKSQRDCKPVAMPEDNGRQEHGGSSRCHGSTFCMRYVDRVARSGCSSCSHCPGLGQSGRNQEDRDTALRGNRLGCQCVDQERPLIGAVSKKEPSRRRSGSAQVPVNARFYLNMDSIVSIAEFRVRRNIQVGGFSRAGVTGYDLTADSVALCGAENLIAAAMHRIDSPGTEGYIRGQFEEFWS